MIIVRTKRSIDIETIAKKIWNKIIDHLFNFFIRYAIQILRIEFYAKQKKHNAIWNVIFKNSIWFAQIITNNINSIFINYCFDKFYCFKFVETFDDFFIILIVNHVDDQKVCQKKKTFFSLFAISFVWQNDKWNHIRFRNRV